MSGSDSEAGSPRFDGPVGRSDSSPVITTSTFVRDDYSSRRVSSAGAGERIVIERSLDMTSPLSATFRRATFDCRPRTSSGSSQSRGGGSHSNLFHDNLLERILVSDTDLGLRDRLQSTMISKFTRTDIAKMITFFNEVFENFDKQSAQQIMDSQNASTRVHWAKDSSERTDDASDIVVFGSVNMDLVAQTNTFPQPNSTQPGRAFQTLPGGKGANEAVACGKLGARTFLIGRVGDDDFGRIMLAKMSEFVNVDGVFTDNREGTGVAMILNALDTKAKTNTPCAGANENVGHEELEMLHLYFSQHEHIRFLLVQLEVNTGAVAQAASIAAKLEKVVILRGAPLTFGQKISPTLLASSHILVVNEAEAPIALGITSGEPNPENLPYPLQTLSHAAIAARQLLAKSPSLAAVVVLGGGTGVVCHVNTVRAARWRILTDDSVSAELVESDENAAITLVLPHFREPVVDVIGAADAYTGGLTAGLSQRLSLYHSLVWASACSAQSLRAAGAQESMPSRSDLRDFLADKGVGVSGFRRGAEPGLMDAATDWPETKPEGSVGGVLRKLEELLHRGDSAGFLDSLTEHLEEGVDINAPIDFQGQTLLHLAVDYECLDSVVALLHAGASVCIKDNYGMTPLDRCHEFFKMTRKVRQETFALIKVCLLVGVKVQRFLEDPEVEGPGIEWIPTQTEKPGVYPVKSEPLSLVSIARGLSDFDVLDADGDGIVTKEEFAALDFDGDGVISREEMELGRLRLARLISDSATETGDDNLALYDEQSTTDALPRNPVDANEMEDKGIRLSSPNGTESGGEVEEVEESSTAARITSKISGPSDERTFSEVPSSETSDSDWEHSTPRTELVECGNFSPILAGDWAASLLRLMLHFANEDLNECLQNLRAVSKFTGWLFEQILDTQLSRRTVLAKVHDTRLPETHHNFMHGCAFVANEAVMEKLKTAMAEHKAVLLNIQDGADAELEDDSTPESTDMIPPALKKDEFTKNPEPDKFGRTALHYAALGRNAKICKVLLSWGHDMYQRDDHGRSPFDHCGEDRSFAELLETLLLLQDAFVSIGHTTETDEVVKKLIEESEKVKLKYWWDKGQKLDARGIRPGAKWTEEIAKAMKGCKTVLIILTRKWLQSDFCEAEAKCALSYNKPIITMIPPVPKDQQASVEDVPPEHPLYSAITQRQVFDFRNHTEAQYLKDLPKVFAKVRDSAPKFRGSIQDSLETTESRITDVLEPSISRYSGTSKKTGYLFIVCGADSTDHDATTFARLLAKSLQSAGISVALGFKQSEKAKDEEYAQKLMRRIAECTMLVIVLENRHDHGFLSSVMQRAKERNKQCIMAPYARMNELAAGLDYTAHLSTLRTWCFTDWMGTTAGLTTESPIYKDVFKSFLSMLDPILLSSDPQKTLDTSSLDKNDCTVNPPTSQSSEARDDSGVFSATDIQPPTNPFPETDDPSSP